ncbi:AAA family ATPase [Planctomicrobium sp. SH527]|uniref:AAA family ATPase n=1 Tax=Planctomicrobium sp. SH527 TaxID=3448123 RepID=UPI003F5C58F4
MSFETHNSFDSRTEAAFSDPEDEGYKVYVEAGRGAVTQKRLTPDLIRGNAHLQQLFDRVQDLLSSSVDKNAEFVPVCPESLEEMKLTEDDVQRLVLKYLVQKGSALGREISNQIKIPFGILFPLLAEWKSQQLISYRSSGEMGDYVFAIVEAGRELAKKFSAECTYFGAAPVCLQHYLHAMEMQTIAGKEATEAHLREAFSDLLVSDQLFDRLGPAINSGRGMFLFGEPGNGKTSIAERITQCFGDAVWIPRALGIDGDIIRVFDPAVHEEAPLSSNGGILDLSGIDTRWVRIARPTIIAGGELTMNELEVTQNPITKICEAPLQLKSNCGTLVIDDFGRQTMPVDVLLNRWIVPLEKRYDFLNLPSGKKVQVPFDQLIIFSTNLEPRDLVDGAFLRRIPYKIEVPDPSEDHFRKLFEIMGPKLGLTFAPGAVDHLVETHYQACNRPFRACQPRDLLLQVKNFCVYKRQPKIVTAQAFDFAVATYFSVM